jgi:hypothetical protein
LEEFALEDLELAIAAKPWLFPVPMICDLERVGGRQGGRGAGLNKRRRDEALLARWYAAAAKYPDTRSRPRLLAEDLDRNHRGEFANSKVALEKRIRRLRKKLKNQEQSLRHARLAPRGYRRPPTLLQLSE